MGIAQAGSETATPPIAADIEEQEATEVEQNIGRLNFISKIRRTAQLAVVGAELSPLNELARYSLLGATIAAGGDAPEAAAVLGGSTLAIEAPAAVASSSLLATEKANSVSDKIRSFLGGDESPALPQGKVAGSLIRGGVALYGGSAISMGLRKIEQPEVEEKGLRKYGLKISAYLAGATAVEGALIAESIQHPSPGKVGLAVAAIGGAVAIANYAKKRIKGGKNEDVPTEETINLQTAELEDKAPVRYDLTDGELAAIEKRLVSTVESTHSDPGIVATWISPDSEYANLIRTHEARYFPEVAQVSDESEENTQFLALVDTREGEKRVVHAATVMRPETSDGLEGWDAAGRTGLFTIDSLIDRGNFSTEELEEYYAKKGVDLTKSISVETNFRIGERPDEFHGLGTAELTYLTLFQLMQQQNPDLADAALFATINGKQAKSFDRVGLNYEPVLGKTDLQTPESELGVDSLPVAILYDEKLSEILKSSQLEIPQVKI